MRKIEKQLNEAIRNWKPFSKQNTVFMHNPREDLWILSLHGNPIAQFKTGNTVPILISLAGWQTPTTKSRLNSLDGVEVRTMNYIPYLNGRKIDSTGWFSPKE